MIMVLPFSNWQLQLPDYFLLGYAVRVLLWLSYTAVMSKASSVLDEVGWLMFRPVKGGRPGEYEEVGQVEEPKGQVLADAAPPSAAADDDDSDDSEDDDDDDDDEGGEGGEGGGGEAKEEEKEKEQKAKKFKSKRKSKRSSTKGTKATHHTHTKRAAATLAAEENSHRAGVPMGSVVHSGAVSSEGPSAMDVRGEGVKARVNGETVILIKKPKTPAASASSSSSGGSGSSSVTSSTTSLGSGAGLLEGVHAMDIQDDSISSRRSEKKAR